MYRGKCKEMSEALAKEDPTLTVVRGFYYEPHWGREEEHWWCKKEDGTIVDPTRLQYPSGGIAEFYRKFDGTFECSECGENKPAEQMMHQSRYHFCSHKCYGAFVGC